MAGTMPGATRYRLQQFRNALAAVIAPDERRLLREVLSPGERSLFERMALFDQRHCLDVYRTLREAGHDDPILLRAALLHDCGKVDDHGRPIPLIYYGMFVLLRRLAPGIYTWAARHGTGPLRPFAVHAAHEARATALARAAGSDPALVALLGDYAARRATGQTLALSWADERN